MKTLEITLPDDIAAKVEQAAQGLGISVEELLASSVVEKLDREAEFDRAATHVLAKNADLYERLA